MVKRLVTREDNIFVDNMRLGEGGAVRHLQRQKQSSVTGTVRLERRLSYILTSMEHLIENMSVNKLPHTTLKTLWWKEALLHHRVKKTGDNSWLETSFING